MTSHSPIELAPDPAVPQRDHLLNFDAMARRLSLRLGSSGPVPIEYCQRECVSYRVGRRLRVVYRIGIDGKDLRVVASTFRSRSRSERAYRKARQDALTVGPIRPLFHDTELDAVFWSFPNDRRIEHLAAVAEADDDLTYVLDRRWTQSRLVDYYPEASAVVRCLDDSNRVFAYAKVHAGDEGERTFRMQGAFERAARGSRLQIARPLGYSKRYRTLMVETMAGPSIGELTGAELLAGLHAYGAALATLHSLPLVDNGVPLNSALDRLKRREEGMCAVRPDIEAPITVLLDELSARWEEAAGEPVLVHGDTNENNAICQGSRVALIDFDRASIGSAGSDIGNFLGLLRYFRSLGLVSPEAHRARALAFVRGYSSVRRLPPPDSMCVHESAALAERAFRAVTRVRRRALPHLPALLAEARSLLHEGARA